MIEPEAYFPNDDGSAPKIVGKVFDAPIVTQGNTWIPLTQVFTWLIMAREAGRLHPERSWRQRLGIGALTMPVILGSEWCHNLAHAAAAWWVGKPADAIRVSWGMPLLVYDDVEDPGVTPRLHILRALGGPVINALFLGIAAVLRRFVREHTVARDIANAAAGMNGFLVFAGLLPLPRLDGSVILKWTLVEYGQTPEAADEALQPANLVTSLGLGVGTALALKLKKRFLAAVLAAFGVISFLVGTGLVQDAE